MNIKVAAFTVSEKSSNTLFYFESVGAIGIPWRGKLGSQGHGWHDALIYIEWQELCRGPLDIAIHVHVY